MGVSLSAGNDQLTWRLDASRTAARVSCADNPMSDAVREQTEALAKDVEVRVWFRAPAVQAALECEHADSPMHPCQYADM